VVVVVVVAVAVVVAAVVVAVVWFSMFCRMQNDVMSDLWLHLVTV
jgi:phage-related minor tail protein